MSSARHTVLAVLLSLGIPGHAQEPAAAPLSGSGVTQVGSPDPAAQPLSLSQAEAMALKNNPRIAEARLLALAQTQVTREARAGEMPEIGANLTAVDSHSGSRITAGSLNNPVVYQRAAAGLTLSQLITDFGRTRDLVRSDQLSAQAQANVAEATAADIILAVDQAFYRALGAQSVVQVAAETVNAREATVNQIDALTSAKLRSTLDLSFANVALAQARMLLLDAQNQSQNAMATLNALLGSIDAPHFRLVDNSELLPPPPENAEALVDAAMAHRPDLAALNAQYQAAVKFSAAEHALTRPTISALATGGDTPIRADQITSPWYGAAGVNISIPVFNGSLFSARAREADLRAQAAQQRSIELRETIARDVRVSTLEAQSNFQRIQVAQQLQNEANSSLDLAQVRYRLGLSSIVELSQAQLAQTQAQIDLADARYAYAGSLAAIRFQTGQ